jgi:hypothetical protein
MTVTLELPADLQATLLARATMIHCNMEEMIVTLLRDSISLDKNQRSEALIQQLEPGAYPEEYTADDSAYQSVPFKSVGFVTTQLIPVGRLMPATFPETE